MNIREKKSAASEGRIIWYWVPEPKQPDFSKGKWKFCYSNVWPDFTPEKEVVKNINELGYPTKVQHISEPDPVEPPTL